MITLHEAIKTDRLEDFIQQEEARGIGPISRLELDQKIAALIKAPQSEGRTSRSPSAGSSTGKRTRDVMLGHAGLVQLAHFFPHIRSDAGRAPTTRKRDDFRPVVFVGHSGIPSRKTPVCLDASRPI